MKKYELQLLIATVIILAGMVLMYISFYTDPEGEISESVLVACGEAFTFAGSLLGMDYHYKNKGKSHDVETKK